MTNTNQEGKKKEILQHTVSARLSSGRNGQGSGYQ